jgi:hypothetical protein
MRQGRGKEKNDNKNPIADYNKKHRLFYVLRVRLIRTP